MARIPNENLLKLRDTFGIDEQFLLSDLNDYTMEGPGNDVIPIDDGIASIDTGLPIYTQDRDGGNNFLQYSDEGAPAYIRDREPAAPINYKLQDPTIMKMANFDELFGPKTFTDSLGNVRTVPGEERFTFPEEKTGILESIKDGGSKLLDFIKSGGITGNILKGLGALEQNPDATFMKDYYGGEDGSNIKDGTIQSGLMAGYNPVSGGFLNMISGGRFGRPTNYGLQRAYQKRIDMISKNLDKGIYKDPAKMLELLEKIKEEKRKEAEALRIATEARQREAQESQRQADQARINRAYREETGGQGGSYATGESGIQRDSRGRETGYNDPFDPGGGE
jgi:hypothetical protein